MLDLDFANRFPRGLIQVAGVRDHEEAEMLLSEGVDVLGIPLHLPVHQPDMSEREAARMAEDFPGRCCCITYLNTASALLAAGDRLPMPFFQIHGPIARSELAAFRKARSDLFLIKSLVLGQQPLDELLSTAHRLAPMVDAFLTDTFDPQTGAEGATGRVHDWNHSRRLAQELPKPLLLAGGLNPSNVAAALQAVQPAGVDSHTGLENPDGSKNADRVRRFVQIARGHFSGNRFTP